LTIPLSSVSLHGHPATHSSSCRFAAEKGNECQRRYKLSLLLESLHGLLAYYLGQLNVSDNVFADMEHKKSSDGSNHKIADSSNAVKSALEIPNSNATEKLTDSSKLDVVHHGNGIQDFQFPAVHDDPFLICDGSQLIERQNQSTVDSKMNVIPFINHDMERLNSSGNSSIDHDPFACIFSEVSIPIGVELMRGTSHEGDVANTEIDKSIILGDTIQKETDNKSTGVSNFHIDGVSEDLLSFAHASSFPSLMTETFDERDRNNRDFFSTEICLDGPVNGKRSKESFAILDDLSTRTAFTPARLPTAQERLDGSDSITDGLSDGTSCFRTHSEIADGSNLQEIGRAKKPTGTIKTENHETILQLTDDDRLEIDGNEDVFSLVRNVSPQRVHAISESHSEVKDQAHAPAPSLDAISTVNAEDSMLFSFPELSSTIFEDEELRFEERVDGVSPLTLMTSGASSPMKVSSTTPKRNTSSHSAESGDGAHSAVGSIPVGDIFLPLPFPDALVAEDILMSESFSAAVTQDLTAGSVVDMDSKSKSTLSGMLGSPPGALQSDISDAGRERDQIQTQTHRAFSSSSSSFSPLDDPAVSGSRSVSVTSITQPSQSTIPSSPHVSTPISAFSGLGVDAVGAVLLPVHVPSPSRTPSQSASHVLTDQVLASMKVGAGKEPPVAPLDPASPAPLLVGLGSSSAAIVTDNYAFNGAVEAVRIEQTGSQQGIEEHVVSDDWGGFNDCALLPGNTNVTAVASCALLIEDTDIDVWSSAADLSLVTADKDSADLSADKDGADLSADKDSADLSAASQRVEDIEASRIKSSESTESSCIIRNALSNSALQDTTIPAFVRDDGGAKEESSAGCVGNALVAVDLVETVVMDKPVQMLAVIEDEVEKEEVVKVEAEKVKEVKIEELEVVKRGEEVVATEEVKEEEEEKFRVEEEVEVQVVERVVETERSKEEEEEEEEDEWDDFEEADVLPTAHSAVLSPMSSAILPPSFDAPFPQRGVSSAAVGSSSSRFPEATSSSDEAAKEAESLFLSSERTPGQVSGLNVHHL
jgi:hypothetical protein